MAPRHCLSYTVFLPGGRASRGLPVPFHSVFRRFLPFTESCQGSMIRVPAFPPGWAPREPQGPLVWDYAQNGINATA